MMWADHRLEELAEPGAASDLVSVEHATGPRLGQPMAAQDCRGTRGNRASSETTKPTLTWLF